MINKAFIIGIEQNVKIGVGNAGCTLELIINQIMTVTTKIGDLSQSLENLLDRQLTGKVIITSSQAEVIIYPNNGELLWVTGENHLLRRWKRALAKCCADEKTTDLTSISNISNYQQLAKAIYSQKISLNKAKAAIAKVAQECFFELMIGSNSANKLTWTIYENNQIEPFLDLALSAEQIKAIILKATLLARQWNAAELGDCSPILSPKLEQEQMYDAMEVPLPKIYLQGDRTIWDIAVKTKTPIILLARSLIALERKNIIKFEQIPDSIQAANVQEKTPFPDLIQAANVKEETPSSLSYSKSKEYDMVANNSTSNNGSNKANNTKNTVRTYDPSKPLIACIDDSPVLNHSVKKILSSVGYQSLIISEPMQGMGLLVNYRPDLILLDLLMPTVNGYAVCKFLRETTLFKTTPIVILTSKDSIVDRTKAKLVGASGFLSKPPIAQELLQIVRLHLIDVPIA